jgi:predicted MFS family arabinose efflux permease
MPPLTEHLSPRGSRSAPPVTLGELVARPTVQVALLANVAIMAGVFTVVPNLSAYVQFNLGFPRPRLGLLYLVGGVASLVTMGWAGRLVDRLGSPFIGLVGTAIFMASIAAYLIFPLPGLLQGPPFPAPEVTMAGGLIFFVALMVAGSLRNVATNALTTQVPAPAERARYMSIQSAVQHLSAALGSFVAAQMLTEKPSGQLLGMAAVAVTSLALSFFFPLLLSTLDRQLKAARAQS